MNGVRQIHPWARANPSMGPDKTIYGFRSIHPRTGVESAVPQPDARAGEPTDQPSCLEPRQKENRIRSEKLASRSGREKDARSFEDTLAVQVDLAFRRVECKELVGAGGKNRRTKNMLLRELEERPRHLPRSRPPSTPHRSARRTAHTIFQSSARRPSLCWSPRSDALAPIAASSHQSP